ncbi:ABC transporter permease [Couchioplanes caeruleus subsp. caeruleus]|uniref:ABC transporter permease n=2 Tax=Couchioplanes caeruleus TaxID=56438 RepID=A0A1K0GUP0_9ACTN|nr:ABC transporter permease [Couchioplanes caeruleus subsp. caeruleus]
MRSRGMMAARSPLRLVVGRLRRDRSMLVGGLGCAAFAVLAVAAPWVAAAYGVAPQETFTDDLDPYGMPYGVAGGVSAAHWFGIEPALGRDLFIQIVFGLRTSLGIAVPAALLATALGCLVGGLAGYLGGRVDAVLGWVTDVALALPFLICAIALIRPLDLHFYGPREVVPGWFRAGSLIGLFASFGWAGTARLVRGQLLSLRRREFVLAARASGAGRRRILVRELLVHLGAPVLVGFSLLVPAYITGEAALSFLGVGMLEPTPDFGRTLYRGLDYLQTDPAYVLFPGVTLFLLVLAVNLVCDGVREALDPRSARPVPR